MKVEEIAVGALGVVEGCKRFHLGDNGSVKYFCVVKLLNDLFSDVFLSWGMIEYYRPILGTRVSTLTVQRCGFMCGEEELQEFSEGDDSRVEGDVHDLGVPCRSS